MAGETLQDLLGYATQNFGYTNIGSNPGTYIPPTANLKWKDSPIPGSNVMGWVAPWAGRNNIHLNPKLNWDQTKLLETLAHEAAHTKQNIGLGELINKDVQQASGTTFPYYDPKDNKPRGVEILAELRAKEAMAPKGQLWYTTDEGKDYLGELRKRYPDKSVSGLIESTDRGMFPEYSMAHPDNGTFTPLKQPSTWDKMNSLVQQMFK